MNMLQFLLHKLCYDSVVMCIILVLGSVVKQKWPELNWSALSSITEAQLMSKSGLVVLLMFVNE